jgi:hypothetical protein
MHTLLRCNAGAAHSYADIQLRARNNKTLKHPIRTRYYGLVFFKTPYRSWMAEQSKYPNCIVIIIETRHA